RGRRGHGRRRGPADPGPAGARPCAAMTGRGSPETVFDGQWLRARLWRPPQDAGTLYVTFRPFMPQPGAFSDDGPVDRALARGIAHLHVQTRMNDWYVNAETPVLEQALRQL